MGSGCNRSSESRQVGRLVAVEKQVTGWSSESAPHLDMGAVAIEGGLPFWQEDACSQEEKPEGQVGGSVG